MSVTTPGRPPTSNRPLNGKRVLDPSWLDVVPASGTLAAVSVALDTGLESLELGLSPCSTASSGPTPPARASRRLRTRLNVLASAARVRPEVDLWPRLKGVTAAVLVDADGRISGAIVALHAVDAACRRTCLGRRHRSPEGEVVCLPGG